MIPTKAIVRNCMETVYGHTNEQLIQTAAYLLSEHPKGTVEAKQAAVEIRNMFWNNYDGGGAANTVTRRIFADLNRSEDTSAIQD